ncbi:protein kinase [Vibrio vulnificus]|nr:protein kinase [Vibrio vulnificus]EJO9875019.1 protein kinase [Vibrio vulnificus]
MTRHKKSIVRDSDNNAYELKKRIGEGGQGIVFTTSENNILVKLLNTKDNEKIKQFEKQLNWILAQNLDDLPLALPQKAITKPYKGYVMELMDELHPLQSVIEESFIGLSEEQSIEKYLTTGGLKRRLKLLFNIAKTLAELHGRGYAYGDLSPANIFVSEDVNHHQAWFIDCDNLCFQERSALGTVFTPGYGSPEVVKFGANVNCQTDAWSFAVIAFELLTHQHPFKGLVVEDGDPDIVEQQAHEAELPWIYNTEDDSNESVGGLDLSIVANSRIIALFELCFTVGIKNPSKRPSLSQWRDALQEAVDQMAKCSSVLEHHFYYSLQAENQECPFCDTVTQHSQYTIFQHILTEFNLENSSETTYDLAHFRVLNKGEEISFSSCPYNTELWHLEEPSLTLAFSEDGALELLPNLSARYLVARGQNTLTFDSRKKVPLKNRDADQPYQIATWYENDEKDDEQMKIIQSYRWQFV